MLNLKSCRTLYAVAAAAIGLVGGNLQAGCNCSVPPAPTASSGIVSGPAWTDNYSYGMSPGSMSSSAYASSAYGGGYGDSAGPHWAPGGYEARVGSPAYYHDPSGGQYSVTGNPYYDHFGPGFQRNSLHGHYRFPYYNYRAPWYFPGRAVYNRDTNFAW